MGENWVNFKAVKQAVSLAAVLERYGVDGLKKERDELVGRCPLHGGTGERTFHASLKKNCFQCFSCKRRGNVLDFVAAKETCSVRDAALKLAGWFSVKEGAGEVSPPAGQQAKSSKSKKAEEESGENKPLHFELQNIDPAHPYLQGRGVDEELARQFGIGFFSGKGSMAGRVVIPIHNAQGQLVAYAGRAVDEMAGERYRLPGGFRKSLELYNLNRVLIVKAGTVVVVEGFFGCLRVHAAGYPCVALMGSSLSGRQEQLLARHFTGALLLLDGDEAGRTGTEECLKRLGRRLWVRAIALPDDKGPDHYTKEEIQQLLLS